MRGISLWRWVILIGGFGFRIHHGYAAIAWEWTRHDVIQYVLVVSLKGERKIYTWAIQLTEFTLSNLAIGLAGGLNVVCFSEEPPEIEEDVLNIDIPEKLRQSYVLAVNGYSS